MTKVDACDRHTEYLAVFKMPDNDVSDCSFLPGLQFTQGLCGRLILRTQ